jgi:hypothetical protein
VKYRFVMPFALSLGAALFCAGCEQRVSSGNLEVLSKQQLQAQKRAKSSESSDEGLTMKEVEAVLGAPQKVSQGKVTRDVVKEFGFTTWTYEQDGQRIELAFVDGKLQGTVPKFGEVQEDRAPLLMKSKPAGEPAK